MFKNISVLNRAVNSLPFYSVRLIRGVYRKEKTKYKIKPIVAESSDFFGIESDISNNITQNSSVSAVDKYSYLFEDNTFLRDKVYISSAGTIRLDSDNVLKFHGQYDEAFSEMISSSHSEHQTVNALNTSNHSIFQDFDEHKLKLQPSRISKQTLSRTKETLIPYSDPKNPPDNEAKNNISINKMPKYSNYIDEQYFNSVSSEQILQNIYETCSNSIENLNNENDFKVSQSAVNTDVYHRSSFKDHQSAEMKENISNYIEEQYFPKNINDEKPGLSNEIHSVIVQKSTELKRNLLKNIKQSLTNNELLPASVVNNDKMQKNNMKTSFDQIKKIEDLNYADNQFNTSITSKIQCQHENHQKYIQPNIENPQSAYDYVVKLRRIKEKNIDTSTEENITVINDSIGAKIKTNDFQNLRSQIQDFTHIPKETLVTILKSCIIYNDNNTVALTKPYGLVCQGGDVNKSGLDLMTCLPDLAKRIMKKATDPMLYLIHTIEKEATGIIILAKTVRMADQLSNLFKENQITKIYWTVTKRIPNLYEGIIDIPIAEGTINGRRRMVLRPELKDHVKSFKKTERAVTHYNVIATANDAALMEVKPETNVKHQVRVHLSFGINCPILGDHKYSHLTKLAPQKLPDSILKRFGIKQSKVRHIPMHLHLKTLIIPEILEGKNLFLHANLPSHFRENLIKLKFRKD